MGKRPRLRTFSSSATARIDHEFASSPLDTFGGVFMQLAERTQTFLSQLTSE
jgi:hypothetical protein